MIAEEFDERGFDVTVALDGATGLAKILKLCPDVVLCDIYMRAVDGFAILARLKEAAAPRLNSIPVILLTAFSDPEIELHARRLGADEYVVKPIDFGQLAMVIDRCVQRGGRRRQELPDCANSVGQSLYFM